MMTSNNSTQNQRVLGVFVLAMISVALIAGLRGLPSMAEYGYGSIFFYILVALTFLLPVSLVSAELATGWPETGGVYVWVKEAFGERWGFMAVWLQWIENVFWYPSQLSFTAGALAYLFTPSLANNRFYMAMVILVAFWGSTFINFKGIKASGLISTVGVIVGTILPGVLIMILAAIWLVKGNPAAIAFKASDLIPDMGNIDNLVFAAGAFLTFAGMEVSAVHAKEVRNPQRDYPRAIFLAAFIATAVFVLATLAIAILVPKKDINIVYGIMQAFETFFAKYNMEWMVRIMGVLISIGAIAMVSTWVIGPSRGLFAAGKAGNMPPVFQKTNKNDVPVNVLWGQGVVVTLLALLFFLLPSVQASFWIMIALSTQLYLIMYVMMYAAAIKLRYSHPEVKRAYNVPGGKPGMWIIAGGGAVIAVLVILIGFLPPSQLGHSGLSYTLFYVGFLLLGIVFMCWVPLYAYHRRRPGWIAKTPGEESSDDGNNTE
jgi:putative glutamate/gamma-aminobutyrate antiporter